MEAKVTYRTCRHVGCPALVVHGKAWCPEHQHEAPEPYVFKDDKRPDARDRGYDWKWYNFSRAYLKKHPACVRCGQPAEVTDHKIPLVIMKDWYGGNTYQEQDYQALCQSCNKDKGRFEDAHTIRLWKAGVLRKPAGGRGG